VLVGDHWPFGWALESPCWVLAARSELRYRRSTWGKWEAMRGRKGYRDDGAAEGRSNTAVGRYRGESCSEQDVGEEQERVVGERGAVSTRWCAQHIQTSLFRDLQRIKGGVVHSCSRFRSAERELLGALSSVLAPPLARRTFKAHVVNSSRGLQMRRESDHLCEWVTS